MKRGRGKLSSSFYYGLLCNERLWLHWNDDAFPSWERHIHKMGREDQFGKSFHLNSPSMNNNRFWWDLEEMPVYVAPFN